MERKLDDEIVISMIFLRREIMNSGISFILTEKS